MVWQNSNCPDIALDIGELIIAIIEEKNQRAATSTI